MKINFIRSASTLSGAEKYNVSLLRELRKVKSLDLGFITNLDVLDKELRKNYVKSFVAPWLPVEVGTKRQLLKIILYAPIFIPRYLATIRKMENGKRFDVICLQSRTEMIFLTPILKLLGCKVVWIQHGPLFVSQAAGIVKKLFVLSSRFVDKIIAVSKDTKKDLVCGGVGGNRITVIYIGVNTKFLKPRRKTSDSFTIGFLGTLTKEKGTDDFIYVANLLRSINTSKQKYLIIGDGPEKERMKSQIRARFTGFVGNVKKYLSEVDILLLPTHHHEGISMAILEAQAMGIPVLATDIGGNREIIKHGYNGFLYKQGDTKSMIHDVRSLGKNKSLLSTMGRNARQTAMKRFNIRIQAKAFAAFFKSL